MPTPADSTVPNSGCHEKLAEDHLPCHICLLNRIDRGNGDPDGKHPDNGRQMILFHPVKALNRGSDRKQDEIQHSGQGDVKVKYRGKIHAVRVLFLNEGVTEAARHKDIGKGNEYQHDGDRAVSLRHEKPRQNGLDDKRHELCRNPLAEAPEHSGKHALLQIVSRILFGLPP